MWVVLIAGSIGAALSGPNKKGDVSPDVCETTKVP
jgi:hypothetical protein